MFIKQSDLLWGLDNQFIKEFIDSAMKKTHPKGYRLFNAGESADFFFILIKGKVKLSVGEQNKTTYLVEHGGEAFGWSGLVGLPQYSASAECLEESMVMIFAKEFVQDITEADPVNGMRFFRRLARMLGNRLIHSYRFLSDDISNVLQHAFQASEDVEAHPK